MYRTMRGEFERPGSVAGDAQEYRGQPVHASRRPAEDRLRRTVRMECCTCTRRFRWRTDANSAKALAFSYPQAGEGVRRVEQADTALTAIVEADADGRRETMHSRMETLAASRDHRGDGGGYAADRAERKAADGVVEKQVSEVSNVSKFRRLKAKARATTPPSAKEGGRVGHPI